ncbi:oligosaccharide flippase family protein [Sphingomonas montanisoli]|uniref:Oligosaccharide flippase family protein n=1 Tax=Sphingomonas montanisoli TaxID=2606412 RepID=A0A5D9BXP4_9SPHN|nr:oligosaccharide flippase family protein [Sphingomonas montanisoli]TZG24174.1 oligosaccharide flippase family protein [Sphingomonas montanisoli]
MSNPPLEMPPAPEPLPEPEEAAVASLTGKTILGAVWMVGWRMTTRLVGLLSTLILARLLAPGDFGLVAMATVISSAIDAVSTMGLIDALVRHPRYEKKLLNAAFSLQLLRGIATAVVTMLLAWPASVWFNEPRLFLLMMPLALGSIISGLENIGIVEFRREMRFDMEFRLLAIPRLLQVVITIILAFTLRSYWTLVIGIVAGKLLRLIMTYVAHPYRPRFSLEGWRELIGFSFWTWLSGLASMVWDRVDPVVIGPAFGAAALGTYLLGMEIATLPITELVAPAAAALFAGVARARGRDGEVVNMSLPIVTLLMLGIAPLTIGLSATSGYVVDVLLGSKWTAAQPLMAIFAFTCLFAPFSYVCTTILLASGRVRQNFEVVAMSAAVKVAVLSAATMYTKRPELIAVASVCTNFVEASLFVIQVRRLGDVGWGKARGGLLRIVLTGIVTVALLYLSGFAWRAPEAIGVLPALLTGGSIGIATLVVSAIVQLALWHIVGRPAGPEQRVIDLVSARLKRRLT